MSIAAARGRQLDPASLGIGRGPVQDRDVTDESRDRAARRGRDPIGDLAPLFALVRDAQLDELVVAQRAVDRRDHALGHARGADLHDRLEVVRETAQVAAVAAVELGGPVFHGRETYHACGSTRRGPLLAPQEAGLYGAIWFGRGMRTFGCRSLITPRWQRE